MKSRGLGFRLIGLDGSGFVTALLRAKKVGELGDGLRPPRVIGAQHLSRRPHRLQVERFGSVVSSERFNAMARLLRAPLVLGWSSPSSFAWISNALRNSGSAPRWRISSALRDAPRACSGLMSPAVPITVPWLVTTWTESSGSKTRHR